MPDREKVIGGLTCRYENKLGKDCEHCHYGMTMGRRWGCDFVRMSGDALALLKAQEPRLMTLEEAASAELVWYDWRTREVRPAKVNRVPSKTGTYRIQRFGDIDEWNHADEYGEYWRCWTSRPTDEQREVTPWN